VRRASVAHRAFGTTKRRPRPRRRRERFWLIRAKEENRTRESSPRAPLCTPATRAIPLPLRKRPRRGRASRRRRPRSRSIPPCVPRDDADAAHQWRRAPRGKPKKRLACRFSQASAKAAKTRKSPRACASPSEAFSEAFYPGEWISNHAPNVAFGFRDGASFRLPRFFLD
jgi:hypothetical protein